LWLENVATARRLASLLSAAASHRLWLGAWDRKDAWSMLRSRLLKGSLFVLAFVLSDQGWADEYVTFLAKQQVGQEITVTGRFRRFYDKKHFFHRNDKTGEVEDFDFFGMTVVPTMLIGNGALSLRANAINFMLVLYPDEEIVKDLPEQGGELWFTGTLIGFQFGVSGIITSPFSGGGPYLLLKRFSTVPPPETSLEDKNKPTPVQ
jgi:hypothetical protein